MQFHWNNIGELPKNVERILKDYASDIKNGKINYGKGKEAYSIFELRKGFKKEYVNL